MKKLLVDYSLIGHGRRFALTLLKGERDGLEVGSRVEVVGDSVPPRSRGDGGVAGRVALRVRLR